MSFPYNEDPGAVTAVQSPASSSHTFEEDLTNPYQQAKHDKTEDVPISQAKIFEQPGSIPLPNAGYHSLGLVWEDVTVHGAGGGKKYVESLDISIFKVNSICPHIEVSDTETLSHFA